MEKLKKVMARHALILYKTNMEEDVEFINLKHLLKHRLKHRLKHLLKTLTTDTLLYDLIPIMPQDLTNLINEYSDANDFKYIFGDVKILEENKLASETTLKYNKWSSQTLFDLAYYKKIPYRFLLFMARWRN